MAGTGSRETAHLTLDELTADPRLARRLPADLARRFRAVPLAEDAGRMTVAMANPDDAAAREAIASVLGPALCLVQADPATIDTLVGEVWGEETWSPLNLAVCNPSDRAQREVVGYAQSLAELLGAQLTGWPSPDRDLVIVGESSLPLIRRLLPRGPESPAEPADGTPPAILVVRQPRWPLTRMLLLLCGEGRDEAAVHWVVRLARASGCSVTVLAIVPPASPAGSARSGAEQGLSGLLSSETSVGRQMRSVARHLVNGAIPGTLRLRQGPPDRQIQHEVAEGEYDLIAVAAPSCRTWARGIEADLVGLLLRWAERPILIAGSATIQSHPERQPVAGDDYPVKEEGR